MRYALIIGVGMDINKLKENYISGEEIFDGAIMHIVRDTVSLPNGNTATREVLRHVGAVCIVPVTDDGKVYMEKQYRYPIDSVITEIPAGKLDCAEEDRLSAAKRELREETGLTADEWQDIGLYFGAPAYSDEKITVYLAKGLHKGEQELDEDEFLDVELVPIEELVEDVMAGRITDGKTQTAILKVARILGK